MKPEGLDYTKNFYSLVWDLISIIKQVDEYSKLTSELSKDVKQHPTLITLNPDSAIYKICFND